MAKALVLFGSIVASAADTFTQVAINTGVSANASNGLKVDLIQLEYPMMVSAAGSDQSFGLSRGGKVAMPAINDDDLLFKDKRAQLRDSGVGFAVLDMVVEFIPNSEIIIIEEQIYVLWKTTAQGVVQTMNYRIYCSERKVSTDERISILQSRIN